MTRLRGEQGSAMMMAVIVLFVILGLGTALIATATGQKRTAAGQQNSESAYALAEAALNAQIYALSVQWPSAGDGPSTSSTNSYGYPTRCNAASNGTSYCPTPNDLSSYPNNVTQCPGGTPGDAWNGNATPTRSQWTTYVRDAGSAGAAKQVVFNDATEQDVAQSPPYNSSYSTLNNASNYVWVRSVATVNCKTVVLITEVSMQTVSLSFPDYVVTANAITAGNNGNKIILNLQDATTGSTVDVSLRCQPSSSLGGTGTPPSGSCDNLSSNQVAPSTMSSSYFAGATSGVTLTSSQLSEVESLAKSNGGYYAPGTCPTEAQLTNSVVYIDGNSTTPANCTYKGNATINSAATPGLLVIPYGTITFNGGDSFYGLVYAANQQNASGTGNPVVSLSGNSTIYGGVDIDGNGAVSLGDSGNGTSCLDTTGSNQKCGDLEYLANAFNGLIGFGGADGTPNTFRQLPVTQ